MTSEAMFAVDPVDKARPKSIQDCLEGEDRPSGFDYARVILALMIMADHSVIVCLGEDVQRSLFTGVLRPLMAIVVPMFFALSGFLVAGSLVRSRSLVTFVGLRALNCTGALCGHRVLRTDPRRRADDRPLA